MWIYTALSHNNLASKALSFDVLYKGLHSFTSLTCLYFPATKHHRPSLVLIAPTHRGMARLS